MKTSDPDLKFPALLLDASNPTLFCGVLEDTENWGFQSSKDGVALENIFPLVQEVIDQSKIRIDEIKCFLYCEGPGSVLGLRLAAMALETWRQLSPGQTALFAYNSLQLTAHLLAKDLGGTDALLISDWKKDAWNAVRIHEGKVSTNEVVDDAALAQSALPVYHLPQRKGWQTPPESAQALTYEPERIIELISVEPLLKKTDGVELSQKAANTFAKWTPQRHRAPDAQLAPEK
ncbi:MAG: hypothetical protein AAGH40_00995 [Verrucomicrobiota bacterium]